MVVPCAGGIVAHLLAVVVRAADTFKNKRDPISPIDKQIVSLEGLCMTGQNGTHDIARSADLLRTRCSSTSVCMLASNS